MEIKLKQLSLTNYKGVKSESFIFTERETFIHGANGTGKTTLFDSFIWCFFGKDHKGRSDYQLKTVDKNGKTKSKASCEVEAVILIDGSPTTLRRVYAENWVKPKGEPEEIFKGNETTYLINDVSVKKSEYDAMVSGWCNETVFKSITNPAYFPNLSKDEQRAILFGMAGEITNESVAANNEVFKTLLLEITGVSFESFRKELLAKKRRVKDELEGIAPRIDELKRNIPEIPDLEATNKTLEEKAAELLTIDQSMSDIATRSENANKGRMDVQSKINELERSNQQIAFDYQRKNDSKINDLNQKISEVRFEIQTAERKSNEARDLEAGRKQKIETLNSEKETKKVELLRAREEWTAITAETLVYGDGAFTCPACERLLEAEDIEAKQAQLNSNFNNVKAKKIDANKSKGMGIAARIKEIEDEIKLLEVPVSEPLFMGTAMDELNSRIANYQAQIKAIQEDETQVTVSEMQSINLKEIERLKDVLQNQQATESTETLISRKRDIQWEIDNLKKKLALKDIIENTNTRILQLENQYKTLNQELADLEKKEFSLKEFEFAKNTEYEARINKMFEFTKFKLFHTQVDGQIIPTCECMVDGVPYSTLNNAMQYGAGLDIINTISRHNNKYAPIWLDNREGVTEIPVMQTQVISLLVNPECKSLKLTIV